MGGTISLDGLDIKQIPVNHLRKTLSFVPQTIQFFHGTVEQNLMLSAPDATKAEVIQACKTAMVWEDIERLSEGLQTRLSDRSTSILNSGFQQKLSLARAYLRKSSVIIFDEPGSNLDIGGDEWFKKTLDSWRGKKTMIMVTHRPSIVKMADKTLVLSHGHMKFFGPTEKVLELLEKERGAA
jgi:ABC-type bacteriocin/lantibiotic exporter with double-glycine peptidase domain